MPANQISNQEVIPEIKSLVFEGHEAERLAVGIVALGNEVIPGLENEFEGYKLLRGNVYAKQKGYMPEDELNDDGTETDSHDARSVHFAVIENAMGNSRVVGAMRLIIKSRQDERPLPVEEHYPEAFADMPAPNPSNESSRLIGRHESAKVQRGIKWLLFTAGVSYVTDNELGPTYGAVERSLARGLQMEGTPVTALGEPKFVEEFNAIKMPIRIDVASLAQKIENDQPGLLDEAQVSNFIYSGVAQQPVTETVVAA